MATKTILEVEVQSNLAQEARLAKAIKDDLIVAGKTRISGPVMAARMGVTNTNTPGGTASSTNLSRGLAGQTGASGRDFAAQAQGLGGLVHVYATFAANLFAVSAAFGALSKAADTTNMIKGLDQLSAQSGRALGGLSKQLVSAADGALSLRDAMTATALATAGGMTNTNMIRMTEIAKKASLALGRDMTDSMDRLTKGIVKIQPELLDELGIMTRVIPAQEAYARQLGKSASSLTDFEKKQAFANAVLDEGERKFNAIKIDANPYSKLKASVDNLAQSFLSFINIPLAPVMTLLADNSVLLGLALAGVAKTLLNQAAPGILGYRMNLQKLAQMSAQQAATVRAEANEQLEIHRKFLGDKDAAFGASAAKEFETAYDAKTKITRLNKDIVGKEVREITKKSPFKLTAEDIAAMKEKSAALIASDNEVYQKQGASLKEHYKTAIAARLKSGQVENDAREEHLNNDIKGQKALNKIQEQTQTINQRYILDEIKSSTTRAQANEGAVAAYRHMRAEIALAQKATVRVTGIDPNTKQNITDTVAGIGRLQAANETVSNSFVILKNTATSALATASKWLSKFGEIGAIIGFAVGVLDLFIDLIGKNDKEMAKFSSTMENFSEAGRTVEATLTAIQDKSPLERMSFASINAISTAFIGLSDSIEQVAKASKRATDMANWVDISVNWVKGLVNADIGSKLDETMVTAIENTFDLLASNSDLSLKFGESISTIFSVSNFDTRSIKNALDNLTPEEQATKFKQLTASIKESGNSFNNYNSILQSYKANADIATKASQDFNISLASSDPMFKLGIAISNISVSLQKLSTDSRSSQDVLIDLMKNTDQLALMSPDVVEKILLMRDSFLENASAIKATSDNIKELEKEYNKAKTAENSFFGQFKIGINSIATKLLPLPPAVPASDKIAEKLRAASVEQAAQQAKSLQQQVIATKTIADASYGAFVKGSKLMEISLGSAGEKIAMNISKAASNSLTGLNAATNTTELIKRDIAIQLKQIDAAKDNIYAIEKLRLAIEENTLATTISNTEEGPKKKALQLELQATKAARETIGEGPGAVKAAVRAALTSKTVSGSAEDEDKILATRALGMKLVATQAQAELLSTKAREVAAAKEEDRVSRLFSKQVELIKLDQATEMFESNIAKIQSDRVSISQGLLTVQNESLTKQKLILENESDSRKQASDRLEIQGKINGLKAQIADPSLTKASTQAQKDARENELLDQELNLARLQGVQNQQNINKEIQNSITLMNIRLATADKEYETNQANLAVDNLRKSLDIEVAQANLQALVQLDKVSAEYKSNIEYSLSANKARLDYSIAQALKDSEIEKINGEILAKKQLINAAIKPGEVGTTEQQGLLAALADESAARTRLITIRKQEDDLTLTNKLSILRVTKETAAEQNALNRLLKDESDSITAMADFADSLGIAFGKFGEAVGGLGKVLADVAIKDSTYLREKQKLQEEVTRSAADAADNQKDEEKAKIAKLATSDLIKLENKRKIAEINNIASIAGASKKMFGEQTGAYKILNGIEKAAHAWKIASIVKEGLIKAQETLATMGITSMASAKAALESVPAVLMKFVETMGWPGVVAGAAFVASLGLGGGGKAPVQPIDQGTLAGTGQQVGADGQTIGTRAGGVLGDPKAEAKSLTDSIDGLSKVFFDNMGSTSSNLLKSLRGIQDNTYNTAKALGASGVIGGSNPFGKSLEGKAGFSTGIKVLDNVLGSIFGGAQSKSVTGSGIMGSGTASGLAKNAGAIQGYTDIKTVTKGGWFSSDKTKFNTEMSSLDKSIIKAVEGIFINFNDTLLSTAEGLGQSKENIQNILDTEILSLKVSNVGLTGTEFAQKLAAEVSIQLNTIAEKAYPFLSLYTKVGEESFQTATRLIKDSETVTFGLKMVGKALTTMPVTADKIAVQQKIIENFGGTADDFADAMTGYYSALFSEEEKAAFKTGTVQERLKELGQTGINTNAQLKSLIATIDPTTKLYADLVKLVPAFDDAGSAAQNLINKTEGLNVSLLQAQGKTAEALIITRNKELAALSASDAAIQSRIYKLEDEAKALTARNSVEIAIYNALGKTQEALNISRETELAAIADILKPSQKYLYALQDEATIKSKLKTAYDKQNTVLTTTVNNLNTFIKSITSARDSLKLGAQSTLTPTEKYAEAKAQLATLKAVIATTGADDASVVARNEALGKLPEITGTFLDASRVLYASSEQYTKDFSSVLDLLDSTAASLTVQQTEADKQLTELKASSAFLDSIDASAQSIESLLVELLAAQGITAKAKTEADVTGSMAAGGVNASAIQSYYKKYLKREPDTGGSRWWLSQVNAGTSLGTVEEGIKNSPEARIQTLYNKLAGRDGELGGVQYWMNEIDLKSKEDMVRAFATSVLATQGNTATELAKKIVSGAVSPVVPGFAKGGLAKGISVVGEDGAELVDFATPSRVYSNKASNDLFNTKELLAEIKRLNDTVNKLVKDQNTQTGHLIASNFAANAEAAQKIADATIEAASNTSWKERSAIKIA